MKNVTCRSFLGQVKNIVLPETLNKPSEEQLVAKIESFQLDKLSCHVLAVPINKIDVCYMTRCK